MQPGTRNVRESAYGNYAAWKGWEGKHNIAVTSEVYRAEMKRSGINPPAKILEVGFGNGDFLVWARNAGYDVSGIEINADFVNAARTEGFRVALGDVCVRDHSAADGFDAVVAFDVLEHLTKNEILEHLRAFRRLLNPGGAVIVRFPNAASPFGLWTQTGDITHETALSATRMEQLAAMTGFEVSFAGNSARSLWGGRRRIPVLKAAAYIVRGLFEVFLGYIYIGKRIPLDMCMTVVLRRK